MRQQKDQIKSEMEMTLKYKEFLSETQKEDLERKKKEWIVLCESNSIKEVEREGAYKRFFKDFENNMQRRMNNHLGVVNQEAEK